MLPISKLVMWQPTVGLLWLKAFQSIADGSRWLLFFVALRLRCKKISKLDPGSSPGNLCIMLHKKFVARGNYIKVSSVMRNVTAKQMKLVAR